MPTPPAIRIVLGTWERLRDDAYAVRHEVGAQSQRALRNR